MLLNPVVVIVFAEVTRCTCSVQIVHQCTEAADVFPDLPMTHEHVYTLRALPSP